MHEAFFNYLKTFISIPLTERRKELMRHTFVPLRLRKRHFCCRQAICIRIFALL